MNAQVFTTSVGSDLMVAMLAPGLNELAGAGQWNFDLDDCDRILRVTAIVSPLEVVGLLASYGIACAELEDFVPEPWMMPTKVVLGTRCW